MPFSRYLPLHPFMSYQFTWNCDELKIDFKKSQTELSRAEIMHDNIRSSWIDVIWKQHVMKQSTCLHYCTVKPKRLCVYVGSCRQMKIILRNVRCWQNATSTNKFREHYSVSLPLSSIYFLFLLWNARKRFRRTKNIKLKGLQTTISFQRFIAEKDLARDKIVAVFKHSREQFKCSFFLRSKLRREKNAENHYQHLTSKAPNLQQLKAQHKMRWESIMRKNCI